MIRSFIVWGMLVSLLFAKTPYEEAMEAFKAKDYQNAFNIFDKNKSAYFNNTLYNYHFGLSSYILGEYEVALSAFERILFDDPSHHYAKLQLGRTFFKLKMYEDAKNEFQDLLADISFPSQSKPQIKSYLAEVESSMKGSKIDVTVGVGVHYDSNIDQVPASDRIYIPLLGANVASADAKEDYYHQELLSLNHAARIVGRGGWTLTNGFFLLNKGYLKEADENTLYVSCRPEISYKNDDYVGKFALQGIKTLKDGNMYSTMFFASPSVDFFIFDSVKTTLEASYFLKRHDDKERKVYDSDTFEGSIAFSNIPIKSIDTSWKIGYGKELKKYDERIDVSNQFATAQISLFAPLSSQFFARWTNRYERKNYLDFSRFFKNRRQDDILSSTFSLLYQPTPSIVGELTFSYQQNSSNQALYEYEKNSIGLSFYKTLSY